MPIADLVNLPGQVRAAAFSSGSIAVREAQTATETITRPLQNTDARGHQPGKKNVASSTRGTGQ
jgi:hypothetical protein